MHFRPLKLGKNKAQHEGAKPAASASASEANQAPTTAASSAAEVPAMPTSNAPVTAAAPPTQTTALPAQATASSASLPAGLAATGSSPAATMPATSKPMPGHSRSTSMDSRRQRLRMPSSMSLNSHKQKSGFGLFRHRGASEGAGEATDAASGVSTTASVAEPSSHTLPQKSTKDSAAGPQSESGVRSLVRSASQQISNLKGKEREPPALAMPQVNKTQMFAPKESASSAAAPASAGRPGEVIFLPRPTNMVASKSSPSVPVSTASAASSAPLHTRHPSGPAAALPPATPTRSPAMAATLPWATSSVPAAPAPPASLHTPGSTASVPSALSSLSPVAAATPAATRTTLPTVPTVPTTPGASGLAPSISGAGMTLRPYVSPTKPLPVREESEMSSAPKVLPYLVTSTSTDLNRVASSPDTSARTIVQRPTDMTVPTRAEKEGATLDDEIYDEDISFSEYGENESLEGTYASHAPTVMYDAEDFAGDDVVNGAPSQMAAPSSVGHRAMPGAVPSDFGHAEPPAAPAAIPVSKEAAAPMVAESGNSEEQLQMLRPADSLSFKAKKVVGRAARAQAPPPVAPESAEEAAPAAEPAQASSAGNTLLMSPPEVPPRMRPLATSTESEPSEAVAPAVTPATNQVATPKLTAADKGKGRAIDVGESPGEAVATSSVATEDGAHALMPSASQPAAETVASASPQLDYKITEVLPVLPGFVPTTERPWSTTTSTVPDHSNSAVELVTAAVGAASASVGGVVAGVSHALKSVGGMTDDKPQEERETSAQDVVLPTSPVRPVPSKDDSLPKTPEPAMPHAMAARAPTDAAPPSNDLSSTEPWSVHADKPGVKSAVSPFKSHPPVAAPQDGAADAALTDAGAAPATPSHDNKGLLSRAASMLPSFLTGRDRRSSLAKDESPRPSTDVAAVDEEAPVSTTDVAAVDKEASVSTTDVAAVDKVAPVPTTDESEKEALVDDETPVRTADVAAVDEKTPVSTTDVAAVDKDTPVSSRDVAAVDEEAPVSTSDAAAVDQETPVSTTNAAAVDKVAPVPTTDVSEKEARVDDEAPVQTADVPKTLPVAASEEPAPLSKEVSSSGAVPPAPAALPGAEGAAAQWLHSPLAAKLAASGTVAAPIMPPPPMAPPVAPVAPPWLAQSIPVVPARPLQPMPTVPTVPTVPKPAVREPSVPAAAATARGAEPEGTQLDAASEEPVPERAAREPSVAAVEPTARDAEPWSTQLDPESQDTLSEPDSEEEPLSRRYVPEEADGPHTRFLHTVPEEEQGDFTADTTIPARMSVPAATAAPDADKPVPAPALRGTGVYDPETLSHFMSAMDEVDYGRAVHRASSMGVPLEVIPSNEPSAAPPPLRVAADTSAWPEAPETHPRPSELFAGKGVRWDSPDWLRSQLRSSQSAERSPQPAHDFQEFLRSRRQMTPAFVGLHAHSEPRSPRSPHSPRSPQPGAAASGEREPTSHDAATPPAAAASAPDAPAALPTSDSRSSVPDSVHSSDVRMSMLLPQDSYWLSESAPIESSLFSLDQLEKSYKSPTLEQEELPAPATTALPPMPSTVTVRSPAPATATATPPAPPPKTNYAQVQEGVAEDHRTSMSQMPYVTIKTPPRPTMDPADFDEHLHQARRRQAEQYEAYSRQHTAEARSQAAALEAAPTARTAPERESHVYYDEFGGGRPLYEIEEEQRQAAAAQETAAPMPSEPASQDAPAQGYNEEAYLHDPVYQRQWQEYQQQMQEYERQMKEYQAYQEQLKAYEQQQQQYQQQYEQQQREYEQQQQYEHQQQQRLYEQQQQQLYEQQQQQQREQYQQQQQLYEQQQQRRLYEQQQQQQQYEQQQQQKAYAEAYAPSPSASAQRAAPSHGAGPQLRHGHERDALRSPYTGRPQQHGSRGALQLPTSPGAAVPTQVDPTVTVTPLSRMDVPSTQGYAEPQRAPSASARSQGNARSHAPMGMLTPHQPSRRYATPSGASPAGGQPPRSPASLPGDVRGSPAHSRAYVPSEHRSNPRHRRGPSNARSGWAALLNSDPLSAAK